MEEIYMAWIEAHTIEDERGTWIGNPGDPEEEWIGPFPGETKEYTDKVWELAMERAIDAVTTDYDEGEPIGYGRTEAEAIADLREQLEERAEGADPHA